MKKTNVFMIIGSFALIICIFLCCIDFFSFNKSFYNEEYIKYDNAKVIGMSEESLRDTTDVLLDYIKDNRDSLNFETMVNNNVREVFNEKEKAHMVDVKNLYLNAMMVRNICAVIVVLCLAYYFMKIKDGSVLINSYFYALGAFLIIIIGIAIYAIADFYNFWINFHYIFFSNDLFFLDPNTDILIQMVPEGFFIDLVSRILISFVACISALGIAGYFVRRTKNA